MADAAEGDAGFEGLEEIRGAREMNSACFHFERDRGARSRHGLTRQNEESRAGARGESRKSEPGDVLNPGLRSFPEEQGVHDDELESLGLQESLAAAQGFVLRASANPEKPIEIFCLPAVAQDGFGGRGGIEGIRQVDPSCKHTAPQGFGEYA